MTSIALIHPPTLTPSVWGPLTQVLEEAGHQVAVPDYSGELTIAARWWRRATIASVTSIESLVGAGRATEADKTGARDYVDVAPGADVLIVFSSAGLLAPLICASRKPQRLIFLDAEVPATEGGSVPDEALAESAARGVELVELPKEFFTEAVGGTPEWQPATVDYLQFTPQYAAHAAAANARGWSVRKLDLPHVAMVTDAPSVVEALAL